MSLDDFDDDLTVPMRPTNHQPNQPPPLAAVRVEPPGPPVAAPGAADLWIPPPRPTRTTGPADSLDGIAWWKVAVAATAALAVGVAAFVMLAGGGDGDGSNGQTPAAVEGQ